MKARSAIFLGLAVLLRITTAAEEDQRIGRILSSLQQDHPDLSIVTADIRDEVIQRIRQSAGVSYDPTSQASGRDYLVLVRLGDKDATKQVVDAFRASLHTEAHGWPLKQFLDSHAHPVTIPFIAEDFSRDDGDTFAFAGSDFVYTVGPVSMMMSRLAFSIILSNDVFSPETKAWAKYNRERIDSFPPKTIRELMQQWWRENEAHFRAGNYQAVRPGQRLPPYSGPRAQTIGIDRLAAASQAQPTLPTPIRQAATAAPETPPIENAIPFSKVWWVVAFIVCASLAGLLFLSKRRA
jgi:hypothetical protein